MENDKNRINLALLLPLVLLSIEIVVVIVLLSSGYEISEFLFIFLIFLALFLVYQISRQLLVIWLVKNAIAGMKKAEELLNSGKPLEAIRQWKKILLNLPQEKYLDVLKKIEDAYNTLDMTEAVQQVKAVQSESIVFFEMTKSVNNFSQKDRQNWQAQAFKLQEMIKALPVERNQDLSNKSTEE